MRWGATDAHFHLCLFALSGLHGDVPLGLEQLNTHLVVSWFRFSVALTFGLLAICLVLTFNGSMSAEYGKLTLLVKLLNLFIGWGMIAYLLFWFQRYQNR